MFSHGKNSRAKVALADLTFKRLHYFLVKYKMSIKLLAKRYGVTTSTIYQAMKERNFDLMKEREKYQRGA